MRLLKKRKLDDLKTKLASKSPDIRNSRNWAQRTLCLVYHREDKDKDVQLNDRVNMGTPFPSLPFLYVSHFPTPRSLAPPFPFLIPTALLIEVAPLIPGKKFRKFWIRRPLPSIVLEGITDFCRIAYDLYPNDASVLNSPSLACQSPPCVRPWISLTHHPCSRLFR